MNDNQMNPTEQKIRECANEVLQSFGCVLVSEGESGMTIDEIQDAYTYNEIVLEKQECVVEILTRHFGQPERTPINTNQEGGTVMNEFGNLVKPQPEQWPKQENVDKLVALCFPAQVGQTNEQKHDADEFFKQPFEQTDKSLDEIAEYWHLEWWGHKTNGKDAIRQAIDAAIEAQKGKQ